MHDLACQKAGSSKPAIILTSRKMQTAESSHIPVSEQLLPAQAFALMLETACEQFEVLQSLLRKEITVIKSERPDDIRKQMRLLIRAPSCINMALAKSFVDNVIRARRICQHGSQHLVIDRVERKRFLSSTSGISEGARCERTWF